MQKITPWLWFNDQAEEAANFYTSIFKDGRVTDVSHYGDAGPGEPGSVLSVTFELHGLQLVGLNGGPSYEFTPAISLFVDCEDQDEVDYYWERLLDGGRADQCGWLQDRYGVSWQIVPKRLGELLADPDPERSGRVMKAMLQMVKLDVAALEEAYRA